MAGHSLGEYTALVCAGGVSFGDALNVVKRRSELMQAAVPVGVGAMAAIIGLDDDAVRSVCIEASGIGVAEAVKLSSPGTRKLWTRRSSVPRKPARDAQYCYRSAYRRIHH
jgi:[acyl-carrier-protein] S-malonyltransferase